MFEKVIEGRHLRFRWTGSPALDPTWRFVQYNSHRGTLYVLVPPGPRAYYKADGTAAAGGEALAVLGREATAKRVIDAKIAETVSVRAAPSSGNPYGRFPEGVEMGLLGRYADMEDVDFEKLTDGLGLRILDEGFIEVYGGCPPELHDEWGHHWKRVAEHTAYRPWALYTKGDIAVARPDANHVKAAAASCGLPEVQWSAVDMELDSVKLKVISTWDRKAAIQQKEVMKGNSANEVARVLGLPDIGYEWLHLIAFKLGGHQGSPQIPKNLVLGTEAANTAMMCIEAFAKEAIADGYDKAHIAVMRAAPVPGCAWYATEIRYMIKLKRGIGAPVYVRESFDPLLKTAPAYSVVQMLRQLRKKEVKSDPPVPMSDTMRKPGYRPRRL